ncbi:hypothetical protein CEXT_643561 [Caerostris extrusa]|uniref:Uncharacterized protein n=1 Tax=Caerostris extrusa TaxID=172846 RepID=A0AAV4VMN8_CAEEX|nr:hypothetical protein CEXT_643561 [Caerostris extrusa]
MHATFAVTIATKEWGRVRLQHLPVKGLSEREHAAQGPVPARDTERTTDGAVLDAGVPGLQVAGLLP